MATTSEILAALLTELQTYSADGVHSVSEGDFSLVREKAADLLGAIRETRAIKAADDLADGTKRPLRMQGIYTRRT